MLGLGLQADPNNKGPFFPSNIALNLKGVTQVIVAPLVKRTHETNAWLNRNHLPAPGYLARVTFKSTPCLHDYSQKVYQFGTENQ
jgi:hypothetical protein